MTKPIPISWYVNNEYTKIEKDIFKSLPTYLGTKFLVPNKGDFYAVETLEKSYFLVNNGQDIKAILNICGHRQSLLLNGFGNVKSIVCPVHHWKYALDGSFISAQGFDKDFYCKNLNVLNTMNIGSFLFKENSSLKLVYEKSKFFQDICEKKYIFNGLEIVKCNYNWKIFMETYLDLYHINSIHPGLRKFADLKDVFWQIDELFSLQGVKVRSDLNNPSENYKTYVDSILDVENKNIIWFCIYPNIMIESYPDNLVISIVLPISYNESINIIEFYTEKGMNCKFKEAYLETAKEDDLACQNMQKGREAIFDLNKEYYGPCHEQLEAGIPSFYSYWHKHFNVIKDI